MPITKRIGPDTITLYDLQEAADLLGVTSRTLRSYVYQGIIPCCRLRRKLYFTDRNLSAFLRGARSTRRKTPVDAPKYEVDDFPPDVWEGD